MYCTVSAELDAGKDTLTNRLLTLSGFCFVGTCDVVKSERLETISREESMVVNKITPFFLLSLS